MEYEIYISASGSARDPELHREEGEGRGRPEGQSLTAHVSKRSTEQSAEAKHMNEIVHTP